jgi:hypothetical protein
LAYHTIHYRIDIKVSPQVDGTDEYSPANNSYE